MSSHLNPYAHLNSRQTALADQFEQEAGADGSDLRDLLNASDLSNSDKAALARAWGGPEAAAEYRTTTADNNSGYHGMEATATGYPRPDEPGYLEAESLALTNWNTGQATTEDRRSDSDEY